MMKRRNLERRLACKSKSISYIKSPTSFSSRTNLSHQETLLKNTGLALYWAEGSKKVRHTVDLANSDPHMIAIFASFIRKIYQVEEKRLRVYLYCFEGSDTNELIKYWSKITHVPIEQFTKPYIKKRTSDLKNDKMPKGLIHLRYHDSRLHDLIIKDMELMINEMLGW